MDKLILIEIYLLYETLHPTIDRHDLLPYLRIIGIFYLP